MSYRFDIDRLHGLAKKGIGLPRDKMFAVVLDELDAAYPNTFHRDMEWTYSNAGGTMGQMKPLYYSAREYVMLFGTPIGTEGHSGRHMASIYEFIIDGEMWGYSEGEMERQVRGPGEVTHLEPNKAYGWRVPDHLWTLEYGRGPLFTMGGFFLTSTALITQDFRTLGRTMSSLGRLFLRR